MKKITLNLIACMFAMSSMAQVTYIDEDFQDTDISGGSVTLASGFAKYNYTADIAGGTENWASSPTAADKTNSVSANSGSGSSQFLAASVGGQQGLLMRGGANYSNASSGFYFTGLNLTGQTMLYFEFDIWGAPATGDSDIPATLTSWSINLNHGNSSTLIDLTDSYFPDGDTVTKNIPFDITNGTTNPTNQTTFDIIDGQWIRISGSIDLTGKTLGSFAAFQIHTDTGGFISGGIPIYAIDNVYIADSPTLSNNSFELNNAISIYPNPVSNILKVKSDNNISVTNVNLVNVLGKTVYTSKTLNDIDVSSLAKGLYILKIDSKDNGVLSKKIIVD